jgi:hypothetical protein
MGVRSSLKFDMDFYMQHPAPEGTATNSTKLLTFASVVSII